MNRYFAFSPAQLKALLILGILIVLLGGWKLVREFVIEPSRPAHHWIVTEESDYHPPLQLNLNTAPADSLELVPGIGPVYARRIVAWREAHGPFRSVDSLVAIDGIGPVTCAKLKKYFLPITDK
jgi:competence ComEA-like helix-hairpin-helix protein